MLGDEEERREYTRLLQELADLMENSERENTEFEQEMSDVQVFRELSYDLSILIVFVNRQGRGRLIVTSTSWSQSWRASGPGS